MSTGLPTTFEPAIEAMIAHSVAAIYNKSAAPSVIATTYRIEANPTAWGSFTLSRNIL